jgi:hypothetical protein
MRCINYVLEDSFKSILILEDPVINVLLKLVEILENVYSRLPIAGWWILKVR